MDNCKGRICDPVEVGRDDHKVCYQCAVCNDEWTEPVSDVDEGATDVDEELLEYLINNLMPKTPEEAAEMTRQFEAGADYIMKHGLSPNLDSIY